MSVNLYPAFHIQFRCASCKKANAQTGTFGFADTQSQR
jgi:hypothetical protein